MMDASTQEMAINTDALSGGDCVRFWRDPRWDDLECLHGTFVRHAYSPHTHDTYVIGVIESGVECYRLNGVEHRAVAGDVCIVNPGEVHDGRPGDTGYRYRMFYPSVGLISGLLEQITERPSRPVQFRQALFRDQRISRLLLGAHRSMEKAPTHLERDSALIEAATLLLRNHADLHGPAIGIGRECRAIARVCDYVQDNLDRDLDLSTLAALVGFSPYRLIRSFHKERGTTPHAWIVGRRIEAAKILLSRGAAPAEVAASCGFYDQAHLTRHFKAALGVTPGRYRAAFLQ